MRKLSGKQKAFAEEYLVDLNTTQAAIRAGYSSKTAYAIGHKLLKKAEIAVIIQKGKDERSKRTGVDQDYVLTGFMELHKTAKEADDLSNTARALENLGKHVGIYEKDNKQREQNITLITRQIKK